MKHLAIVTLLSSTTLGLAAQEKHPVPAEKMAKDIVTTAVEAGQFGTLVTAVKAAGLVDTLKGTGPFTVFAPTDEAFARLGQDTIADLLKPENRQKLTAILTYHVAAGELPAKKVVASQRIATLEGHNLDIAVGDDGVRVGNAKVVTTDVRASNGVIHVIDTVLLPPSGPANLVAVASQAGGFATLIAAAKAAGLDEVLATGGPFTIFAPTDAAFAALGKDKIAELLMPKNRDQLASILKYHVVSGSVMAADVVKLTSAKTLQGAAVKIAVADGKVKVDGANVVKTDVPASNGVIHVIDAVILPQ